MSPSRSSLVYSLLLSLSILNCGAIGLLAQEPVVYNRDKSLKELTLPSSPEAFSVTKYADVPFTHSSGMAELGIPIYTLQGKSLSIPISLSYRSGGIRVSEVGGIVGLGWSLQAGGCITRDVIFLPDEYRYNGYGLYQQPSGGLLDSLVNNVSSVSTREYLTGILWNQKDCSSDRYRYNVCGLSGTFIINPLGEIVHLSGDGCVIEAHRATNGMIDYFTLTGPDGSVYTLADRETGTRHNVDLNPTPMSGAQVDWSAPTAWYVSGITSADGLESATFTYSPAGTWVCDTENVSYNWTVTTQGNSVTYTGHHGPNFSTDSREHAVIVLSSISLHGTTVSFSYASESGHASYAVTGRAPMNNYPRRLSGIGVSMAGHPHLMDVSVFTGHGSGGRVTLDSLRISRDGILDDRWSFSYEPTSISSYYSQDWFGYANGESGRSTLVPFTFPAGNGAPVLSYGFPDASYAKGGMLKRADHDGAVTEYEYEGNAVGSGDFASSIGVRVKSIKVYDGETLLRVRRFTYDSPQATLGYYPLRSDYVTSSVDQRFEYHPLLPNVVLHVLYDWTFTLHDSPVGEGESLSSSRVIYGHVVEDCTEAVESSGGQRTEYWFNTSASCAQTSTIERFPSEWKPTYTLPSLLNYVPSFYSEQYDRGVGLLTRKEIWRYVGDGGSAYALNGYDLAESEDWTYTYPSAVSVLTGYTVHQVMHRVTSPGGDVHYSDLYHYPVWSVTQPDLSGSTVTRVSYHEHGNDTLVLNTRYALRRSLTDPNRVASVSTSVGGRSRNVNYAYPDTWGLPAPSWVRALAESHRLSLPLGQVFVYGEAGRDGMVPFILDLWKRVDTQYDSVLVAGVPRLMPVRRIETTGNSLCESWREEYLARDCIGNVTELKERGVPRTVILWSYNGMYPVAVVENATLSEVTSAYGSAAGLDSLTTASIPSSGQLQRLGNLRSLLPGAHITTYTYSPGIGMTSCTSPSGKKETYEYDSGGRLSVVKDASGHSIESHTYSLLNQGDGRRSIRHRQYRNASGSLYSEDVSWWNSLCMHTQDIAMGASGDGRDLVSIYEGDFMLHDDNRTWLPYPVQGSGGAYQEGAISAASSFHGSDKAYMLKSYELSSRDKVVSLALPGLQGAHETTISEDTYQGMLDGLPILEWEGGAVVNKGTYPQKELLEESAVDADGRRVSVTRDHAGRTLALAHGPASHTPTIILNDGIVRDGTGVIGDPLPTLYVYDRHDQLRAVIGSGIDMSDTLNMWRYGYDSLGRLSSKGIPGAVREYYTYDDEDRIVSIVRGGELIENEFDTFGRLSAVYLTGQSGPRTLIEEHSYDSYPDSSATLVSLYVPGGVWDGPSTGLATFSRLAQLNGDGNVDGYCSTAMFYDNRERLVGRISRFPDGIVVKESLTLNFPGEVTESVTIVCHGVQSDTLSVSYQYDLRGRVVSSTTTLVPHGSAPVSATTQYSYDALGRASGWSSGPLSQSQSYTLQGWLASNTVNAGVDNVLDEVLHYFGATLPSGATPSYTGLVAARSMVFQNPGYLHLPDVECYSYDHAGRLTSVKEPSLWRLYSYDTRGNLLSSEEVPFTGSFNVEYDKYTYSYSGDRLTSISQDHYIPGIHTHKPVITHVGDWSFTHDAHGRMVSDGLDGKLIDYNYLGLPRKVGASMGNITFYSYLADGMKTSATNGSTGAGLVYRGPMVYSLSSNGTLTLDGVSFGEGWLCPGGVRYYVSDRLGSVKAVMDGATGAIYSALDYGEYGAASASSSVSTSPSPSGETYRHRFTGKEDQGPDFGVPYTDFGARHYSPLLRRWLTPDPLSEKYYDISHYAYCANNPVNLVDPDGNRIFFINGFLGFGSPKGGEQYWDPVFIARAKQILNDADVQHDEFHYRLFSSAKQRRKQGYKYAKNNVKKFDNLNDGETIKLVTHSMGAAFAEGMADYLIENGYPVEMIFHFEPYQASSIDSNGRYEHILTIDIQTKGDWVIRFMGVQKINYADYDITIDNNGSSLLTIHRQAIDDAGSWDEILNIIYDFLQK